LLPEINDKVTLDVRAVLSLDVLKSARVVAGAGGLARPVRWVHIVDIPEVVEWVREGDLLLTTAFALREQPALQEELVPALAAKQLAGLVVGVGRYVSHLPVAMLKQGDAHDFPLVELPWEVPFESVTRAVSEQILARQMRLLTQSAQIHATLTQLVLRGKDLSALADTLADLVGRSVTLEDAAFNTLAYATRGPTDPVRVETIVSGRTPPPVLQALQTRGILETLGHSGRPVHVPPIPEVRLLYERIVMPVVVGSRTYGYVWIIAGDTPLAELDYTALEHGATVAALMMLQQKAVSEAEQRLRGDLLDELLTATSHSPLLSEQARRFGYPLEPGGHSIMLVQPLAEENAVVPGDVLALATLVEGALRAFGVRSLVVARGEHVVALLAAGHERSEAAGPGRGNAPGRRARSEGEDPERSAEAVYRATTERGWAVAVGLGLPQQAVAIGRSYAQALESLDISLRLRDRAPGVYPFNSLGLFHWLYLLRTDSEAATNRYVTIVSHLAARDAAKGSALLPTLECYLDSGSNALETARRLNLHRNTLGHRLQKIEYLCELKLDDPTTRLNLQVAIKFHKLI
jgi:purine catabolism regulator